MSQQLADELERFIERDGLWDTTELDRYVSRLAAGGDAGAVGDLTHAFTAVRLRLQMSPVPDRLRREVESVFYPGLWKVLEALRDQMSNGEQQARVQVLNRRLARLFVEDDPHS